MEESSGGNGVKGLASKVTDIDGKMRPKSILKPTRNSNVGFEDIRNMSFPDGLSSCNKEVSAKEGETGKEGDLHGNGAKMHGNFSYAEAVNKSKEKRAVAFRELKNEMEVAGSDVVLPLSSIKEVSAKFDNTLYGYFIGKRLAYPIVEQFARNAWTKFGFTRAMMNGKGFFFFKFDSKAGMDRVLEEGPWMIRNIPIIMNLWTPTVSLSKEGNKSVPVWVKLHDVPLVAFTEDGLSLIATKLGTPKRLDGYTSDMCRDLWGRSSFARALVEISSEKEMLEEIVIAIPSIDGEGYVKEKIKVEYDWKPPRCGMCCVFGHTDEKCVKNIAANANGSGQKSQEEADEDGFRKGNNKKQMNNKGPNKGGFSVNPKIVYKPVKHPMELPVYRKRAAEWKKKHPNANGSRYGQHNSEMGAKENGSGSFSTHNSFSALNEEGLEQSVAFEKETHEKNTDSNDSHEGRCSEGASTPGVNGLNG